jgi:DNA end-binding protein Ku
MAKATTRRKTTKTTKPATIGRPAWTGQLKLALVSVPVAIYPATTSGNRIAFHQIHGPSGKRIRYEKVVPGKGAVETDEIMKGVEISRGKYVLLDQDEIDAVKLEGRKTIDLLQFVDPCEIEPIWFERPYFVVPDGEMAEEAYGVIRDALRSKRKMGIGQFIMRGRDYIAALKPCGDGMTLETLRFADEVRDAAPVFADIGHEKADPELMELAGLLIDRKSAPFDADRFHDRYSEALHEAVAVKAKSGKPLAVDEEEKPERSGKVVDLVEALKRSLSGGGKTTLQAANSPKPKAPPRKKAG